MSRTTKPFKPVGKPTLFQGAERKNSLERERYCSKALYVMSLNRSGLAVVLAGLRGIEAWLEGY